MHGRRRYKTQVTDYEGMQGALDTCAAQGWRLLSVTPDTFRKMTGTPQGMEGSPFETLSMDEVQEYSASYYLLVFEMDDEVEGHTLAALEEALPGERPAYEM